MSESGKIRRLSRRLVLFILVFVILLGGSITLINYYSQLEIYEDKELSKLSAITNTLVNEIDGDQLAWLISKYPDKDDIRQSGEDSTYWKIHKKISMAMESNNLTTNIYTMALDSSSGDFVFGITTAEIPYWKHSYSNFPKRLKENYETGGVIPPYTDENGVWLSAFAPIKDSTGRVVSVLQVDELFNNFIMRARKNALQNSIYSLLVAGILAVIMIYVVRTLALKQEKLDEQRRDLERMRKELIANVSHDLRTPLAYIQGYLETLLMKKDLDEERREKYLKTSLSGTEKLKKLVDELFDLSRIESGNYEFDPEPILLIELVADILQPFRMQAAEKQIELKMEIPIELSPVEADVALLDRVFQNLISNSLKYCKKYDTVIVRASEDAESDGIMVEIEDNGPGIARDDMPTIFDRFKRGDQLQKEGTGLGLAIVKSILDLHQCRYGLESEEKKGTKFYFVLPQFHLQDNPS